MFVQPNDMRLKGCPNKQNSTFLLSSNSIGYRDEIRMTLKKIRIANILFKHALRLNKKRNIQSMSLIFIEEC